ncbi:MAG: 23S rRNA (pseudouridine(1915)-N(3))-methyltransferase RlmH [Hyphomonadaceae bacterium]
MRIRIAAIGRVKGSAEADLIEDYRDRATIAGARLGLGPVEIVEAEAARAGDKARESQLLLQAAPKGARRILLDERGDEWASRTLAAKLAQWRDNGLPAAVFWIGGPDGAAPDLRQAADDKLAFGPQTWPHKLVRVMLAEQIYRAVTILSGNPYHRD